MTRVLTAAVLAVGLVGPAFAQSLTTNEPTKGRINKEGETNEWAVEIKEDGQKLRFSVASETTGLKAWLVRDAKTFITLYPANGKGGRVSTHAVVGKSEIECEPEKPLTKGTYTIRIEGARKSDIGPYTITLLSPKFEEKQPVDPVAPAPGGGSKPNEVADLKKEVAALKDEMADLKSRLRILEKLVADRK